MDELTFDANVPALLGKDSSAPRCAHCQVYFASDEPNSPPKPLMKCAGCLNTYYCSKDHQRMDWKRHKALCKFTQSKLAALAAAEAEVHLAHNAVVPSSASKTVGLFPGRRFGSNSQLCSEQREQQTRFAALRNVSSETSGPPSTADSPPNDGGADGQSSAGSSAYGSMADLISSTPYYTAKGGRSVVQTMGNPKRARFPLTVIRERRSSIGAGEAARLAVAAAAAAAADGKSPPSPRKADDEGEEMETESDFAPTTMATGVRKRPASSRLNQTTGHPPVNQCASDATVNLAARLQDTLGKKDQWSSPVLDLATDPRFQLDAMVPRQAAFNLRVRRLAMCVAASLREYGWCVVDHFLGEIHARAIYHETVSLYMTPGLFADGQLMKAPPPEMVSQMPQLQSPKDVRSDQIYWFDNRVDRGVHISFLVSMVDSIVFHLTDHIPPYRINGRSRAMIACYPGQGTKYVRHVDNPDRDGRCVTTIYYINEQWKLEHGGILRLHPESSRCPVDVQPLFDRLLFFWSDRRNPHEVLPAYQRRFAITIWYFDAEERAQALAREQKHQKARSHTRDQKLRTRPQGTGTSATSRCPPTQPPSHARTSDPSSIAGSWLGRKDTPPGCSSSTQSRPDGPPQSMAGSSGTVFAPPASPTEMAATAYTHQALASRVSQSGLLAAGSLQNRSQLLPAEVIRKLMSLSASSSGVHDPRRGEGPSPEVDPVGLDD